MSTMAIEILNISLRNCCVGVKKLGTGGMDAIKQINWPDQKSKVVMDES